MSKSKISIPSCVLSERRIPYLVVPDTEYNLAVPVIVGTNYLREVSYVFPVQDDWQSATPAIFNAVVGHVRSTNQTDIVIEPFQATTLSEFTRKLSREVMSAVTESADDASSRIGVSPRLVSLEDSGCTARVPVRIYNMSAKPVVIKPKTLLSNLYESKALRNWSPKLAACEQKDTMDTAEAAKEFTKGLKINLDHISSEERPKIEALFYKWKKVFSLGPLDLGNTDIVKHEIHLTDDVPFKEPYRRVPPALIDEVREHLQEMLDMGAIRSSQSPFSSNVVIVRKKDGPIQFCIDFRRLNNRTVKDAYAIPRIDDSLHVMAGSKYFTKLDLKAGYWQVELNESDKPKTAFQGPYL